MQTQSTSRQQSGALLLEALVAILIFSLGILGIISLQANAIKLNGEARYRTNATLLANKLIGQMWVAGGTIANLKTRFESPSGADYTNWLNNDVKGFEGLPGIAAGSGSTAATLPTVAITSTTGATDGQVTITLFWRSPDQASNAPPHQYVVTSQIHLN